METKFNFNSAICTSRSQSERLLALGLKKETADMVWIDHAMTEEYDDWKATPVEEWDEWNKYDIPAWSLHRLIEMLGCVIQTNGKYISLPDFGFHEGQSLYDNIINCIEWLIKEGYFNKEYLV